MKYEDAPDLKERMREIVNLLGMNHVKLDRVECLRSYGSSTKRTIARCHALGKLMQNAMKTKAFYAIEFLEFFGGLEGGNGDRHQNAADDEGEENDGKAEVVTGETIEKDQQLIDGVNDEI